MLAHADEVIELRRRNLIFGLLAVATIGRRVHVGEDFENVDSHKLIVELAEKTRARCCQHKDYTRAIWSFGKTLIGQAMRASG